MCGICGIVNVQSSEPVDRLTIERMTQALAHRGPDDSGYFVENSVGLGHRRLSIIDLSGGKQPIYNEDRSATIVFNGEIYNYQGLAERLTAAGHTFRTRSDTETILHAYEEFGDDCVDHLRGMFGIAIWDRRRRRLLLARDRLGVKPIYYYSNGRQLAFASEIKSLLELQWVPREVDSEALDLYLALRYVPGPRTMFRGIYRLQPGHLLTVDEHGVHTRKYWDIDYNNRQQGSSRELVERFTQLFEESVRLRLIAEVPLGVFLSGGLDSSATLAMMSKIAGGERVKTFSVGYEASSAAEEESNEFAYARTATEAFAVEHHEYRLTSGEFQNFIPDLVWYLDEPLADPSCIPLYFISKLAREHITVVLSGEGADETLAGYGIYSRMLSIDRIRRGVPGASKLAPWLAPLAPSEKLRHYMRAIGLSSEQRFRGVSRGLSTELRCRLVGEDRMRRSEQLLAQTFDACFQAAGNASPLNRMLYADTKVWLPDDLLIKADKMTMANALELRVPFLDHKLVEFAAGLPDDSKLKNGSGKSILRQAMRGIVPDTIIDRPKKGFPVPLSPWLRGPLCSFTRDHLLDTNSACGRFFDRDTVTQVVQDHVSRRVDRSQDLWTLLVFEFWHRHFIQQHSSPAGKSLTALAQHVNCGELS